MMELFLLGAGASVEAGVKDAYSMTDEMLKRISDDYVFHQQKFSKILQFVVGGLLFQQGIKGENPSHGVNIEDLFNTVKLLGDRQKSELGPFISSWHPQLVGLESNRDASFTSRELLETINKPIEAYIDKTISDLMSDIKFGDITVPYSNLNRIATETFASSNFEEKLIQVIGQVVIGGDGELFKATADAMVRKLVEMVWITNPQKVDYLELLIRYAKDKNSTIATLNYDNSIELAGQIVGVEVDTGFDSWSRFGKFDFDAEKIPLLKLHGSIDWGLYKGITSKEKPLPFQIIKKVDMKNEKRENFHPAVVFGGKNKLTAEGPFLSLISSFEQQLSKAEVLTIIGYSFRDEHVNEFITNWFNGEVTRRIRIINPNLNSLRDGYAHNFLNGYAKTRVQIIEEKASIGISRIVTGK